MKSIRSILLITGSIFFLNLLISCNTSTSPLEKIEYLEPIVFESNRNGEFDIFIMEADGSNLKNLTITFNGNCHNPVFNAITQKIAFTSDTTGNEEIYIYDLNLHNIKNISNHESDDTFPQFTPDGTMIIFYSNRNNPYQHDDRKDIYSMSTDGSNAHRITNSIEFYERINISRTNSSICYDIAGRGIYTNTFTGGNSNFLYNYGKGCWGGVFSPSGEQIAFINTGSTIDTIAIPLLWEIYVIDIDGNNLSRLSKRDGNDYFPQFSPDGSYLTYTNSRYWFSDIIIIDLSDSTQTKLTDNITKYYNGEEGFADYARFNQAGNRIIYESYETTNWEIFSMNLEGSNKTNLTNNTGDDFLPTIGRTIKWVPPK
jgi:TolB protein